MNERGGHLQPAIKCYLLLWIKAPTRVWIPRNHCPLGIKEKKVSNTRSRRANAIIAVLGDRPVAYHNGLTKALLKLNPQCSPLDALFICQMLYWDGKSQLGGGWIWKTREEWFDELGLSRRNQETIRKHLTELRILEEQLRGMPGKMHYRLNYEYLQALAELAYPVNGDEEQELLDLFAVGSDRTNIDGTDRANTDGTDRTNSLARSEPRSETTTEITSESTAETTPEGWSSRDLQDYLPDIPEAEPETDGSSRIDLEERDVEFQCPACGEAHPLPGRKTKFACPSCQARLAGYIGGVLVYKPPSPPNQQRKQNPELQLSNVIGDRCPVGAHRVYCSSPEQADEVRKAYRSNPDHFLWWIGMVMQWQIKHRKYDWGELVQVILDRFYQKEAENNQGKETRIDVQQEARDAGRSTEIRGPLAAYLRQSERDSGFAAPELRDSE